MTAIVELLIRAAWDDVDIARNNPEPINASAMEVTTRRKTFSPLSLTSPRTMISTLL